MLSVGLGCCQTCSLFTVGNLSRKVYFGVFLILIWLIEQIVASKQFTDTLLTSLKSGLWKVFFLFIFISHNWK